ncbi:MAG: hypothetical protein Q8M40_11055 [Legionella sp.]|nr:hypothetical protein [Legionella sp.]
MTGTIGDFLKELNIEHNLPLNHSLLNLPLSLFHKSEYCELTTIFYLLDISTDTSKRLGNTSYDDAKYIYGNIKLAIQEGINGVALNQRYMKLKNGHFWYNKNHINIFIKENPLYYKLIKLWSNDFLLLAKYMTSTKIDNEHLIQFNSNLGFSSDNWKSKIDNMVKFLIRSPTHSLFNHLDRMISDPLLKPYPLIIRFFDELRYGLYNELFRSVHSNILDLQFTIPTTIGHIITTKGIYLPQKIRNYYAHLLHEDLADYPELNDDQRNEFLFYTLLFIFGNAQPEPELIDYKYSDIKKSDRLKSLGKNQRLEVLKIYNDHEEILKNTLTIHNLTMHPVKLALLCFENSSTLKNIFKKIWPNNFLNYKLDPNAISALIPSSNPLLLGHALCSQTNINPKLTINDTSLILEMLEIAKDVAKGKHDQIPSFRFTFFEPNLLKEKFYKLKTKIQNPEFKDLDIENITDMFQTHYAINFWEIENLIINYNIYSPLQYPPRDLLLSFRKLTENNVIVDDIIIQIISMQHMHLDEFNVKEINSKLSQLNKTIGQLKEKLEEIAGELDDSEPGTMTEELYAQREWLYLQLKINIKLIELFESHCNELESESSDTMEL